MKNKITKRYCTMCILLGVIILLYTGCGKRYTEEDAFKGVEDIVNEEQINIHFAYKGRPLDDEDNGFWMTILLIPEKGMTYDIGGTYKPDDGKLGVTVKTLGNSWSIGSSYFEPNTKVFEYNGAFAPSGLSDGIEEEYRIWVNEIYKNASWKLEPLLSNYHIWLDDCVWNKEGKEIVEVPTISLFNLIDETTGETFRVDLTSVWDNSLL